MRSIEFRGKRIDNGEWIIGSYCHFPNPNILFINDKSEIDTVDIIPESVGQFTGKFDKNGKKIFEGDILKCRYYKHAEKDLYLIQKVVFAYSSFFVVTNNEEPILKSDIYNICPLCWVDECEIIGNSFDNPEL